MQNNQDEAKPPNWRKRNFAVNGGIGAHLMAYQACGIPLK
jgi:hypothetical protein